MHDPMAAGLREIALRDPGRPALILPGGDEVSFGTLEALANRWAHLFAACGLGRGDHAAVLLGNGAAIFALAWAAWRSGVYLTPVSTALAPPETAWIVNDARARLVIAEARFARAAAVLPAECRGAGAFLSLGGALPGFEPAEPRLEALPATPRADESPGALMLYSSGTTGRPKGIWRPLADPAAIGPGLPPFARDLAQVFGFGPATRWISPGPLYHAAPLRFSLAVNAAGGLVAVMEKFEAREALRLIDALELTDTQWVPTMFQRLLALPEAERRAFRGTSHRRAIHGAAPCTPALKRAMIAWWGPILDEYYAGSESIGLTRLDSTEWLAHPGSVGRPAIGTAHILGEGDEELPAGATGRVFFGGRPGFGYFGDDGKTATRTSRQGWQSLGDIGHVDTEGYLYLSDRLDDMIISGGVNVYPQEIEAAIEEVEGVLECGVVGMPDPEFDERPVAFVVAARPGETEALRERLLRHLGERLGRIRQPREIHFVTELPRSPAGKLLRRELRSRA